MRRPTIFISPTIYDFHDLRSALKDYLELRGCTVYASDYNDFAKDVDKHSYDACIQAIEEADIFVLFIGSRVGGLVDAATGKSITRAEYEKAYELAAAGRIRIVSFVRNEVWTHRESIKEVERFLRKDAADQRERPVTEARTKFMTDAGRITEFIELVSRNAETAAAVRNEGGFPIANWLHRYSTFGEIRSVLDPLILAGFDVPQAAGRTVLHSRLVSLLQGLLFSTRQGPAMPTARVRALVGTIGLTVDSVTGSVELAKDDWTTVVMLATYLMRARADAGPLLPFLSDPLLLDYDPAVGAFQPTPEHAALDQLVDAIADFNLAAERFSFSELVKGVNANRPPILVEGAALAGALSLFLRWATVTELSLALARAMDGQGFSPPVPMPKGPFVDQEASLQSEALSRDAVRDFVRGKAT